MSIKSKISEIKIVELNKKGNGIGVIASPNRGTVPVEVSFTLPEDVVKALIINRKKKKVGILQEIIKASPLRQEPRCKHFGECGGCRFQNLSYSEQLKIKEKRMLSSFGPLLSQAEDIRPIIGCESEWNYRNKMEFSFSEDFKGNRYLGLIKDLSKGKVVSLEECHLVSPWFSEALQSVRNWWAKTEIQAYSNTRGTGSLRTLTLREGMHTGDRMAILTVSGNSEYAIDKKYLDQFVEALDVILDSDKGSNLKSIYLRIQQAEKGFETNFFEIKLHGSDHIRETIKIKLEENAPPQHFSFLISPTAFFQPNTVQAGRIYEEAILMAEVTKDDVLYDLYCGTGTLGIIAAKKVKQVVGVEISPESILNAKTNAKINGIENIHFFTGAVRNVLPQIMHSKTLPHPDIVVVNPPRPGLDPEAMSALIELAPTKILYIACFPETQSENLKILLENGYKIAVIQAIDQFPHTPHLENVVYLKKDTKRE